MRRVPRQDWSRWRERWSACELCGLRRTRRNVVLGSGAVPAELLVVGEAPGRSEDLVGKPFVGPSGRLLRQAMVDAARMAEILEAETPTCYVTNVVACRPCDTPRGDNRRPTEEEVWRCVKRLEEEVLAVQPVEVLLLGQTAAAHARKVLPGARTLLHPAFILRRGGRASPEYRTFARQIADAFEAVLKRRREDGEEKEGGGGASADQGVREPVQHGLHAGRRSDAEHPRRVL